MKSSHDSDLLSSLMMPRRAGSQSGGRQSEASVELEGEASLEISPTFCPAPVRHFRPLLLFHLFALSPALPTTNKPTATASCGPDQPHSEASEHPAALDRCYKSLMGSYVNRCRRRRRRRLQVGQVGICRIGLGDNLFAPAADAATCLIRPTIAEIGSE